MQAVILMAGKGTRMAKHYEGPKQLLPVLGKPILEHVLDSLPKEIDELIFVVGGPHEDTIREYFSDGEYNGLPITFVVQEEQLGLAHAFGMAKDLINGRWFGCVADDIFDPDALQRLVTHDLAILSYPVDTPENFGVLVTDDDGYLKYAVEKPQQPVSNLVFNGAMVMDEMFFDVEIEPSARGEYETADVWMKLIEERGRKIKVVKSGFWLPINDKDQLERAEEQMKELLD